MMVPLIQTHSDGLKQPVLFNSHTVAVESFLCFCGVLFWGFFFLRSVNLKWSNGWRRQMSGWLSVTSAEGWNRQTARWCLLSDTLEMDSQASVCCPVRLNLSPFAVNWSCLPLYQDGILLSNWYITCLVFYTRHVHVVCSHKHTHTQPLSVHFMATAMRDDRNWLHQSSAQETHISSWWSEQTHRKNITSDVMNSD